MLSEDQKLLDEIKGKWEYYYTDLVAYVIWASQNKYFWVGGRLPGGKTPEDVAQEIMLKTINGIRKTYDPNKGSLRTWFHQQVDSFIDALAKSAMHRTERELPEDELFASGESDNPEHELLEKERWEEILQKVNVLLEVDEPDLREIIEAIVFQGCEPKTRFLAEFLGTDAKDITNRLRRLRRLNKKGEIANE